MTYENKYKLAEKSGIMLPKEILKGENIVGIYEFFITQMTAINLLLYRKINQYKR